MYIPIDKNIKNVVYLPHNNNKKTIKRTGQRLPEILWKTKPAKLFAKKE